MKVLKPPAKANAVELRALRLWAESGQIEHYKFKSVSTSLKVALVWLMIGGACGFGWGVLVAVSFMGGGG